MNLDSRVELALHITLYVLFGHKVIIKAVKNILRGKVFDENFLMAVASIGAICVGEWHEAIAVMLLYNIGEFLQDKAVDNSRRAISDLMDIRPDFANVEGKGGQLKKCDPSEVGVGSIIVVAPGERVPLDGEVIAGSSRLDTAALTGESLPADVQEGSPVYSGTVNLDGLLKIRVTKNAEQSTVSRILELIEDAAASRARAENFITRFAQYYTPVVCGLALVLAVVPSVISGDWTIWVHRALVFLVTSCPCALVISIPLGFFGGIGGASAKGILIKGGNYLEALSKVDTVVFDKTGTLTKGVFEVVAIHPSDFSEVKLMELAVHAESFSNHPIARSLADEYGKPVDKARVRDVREYAGMGISADVDGFIISCGNDKMMDMLGVAFTECKLKECRVPGTTVHVVIDGAYAGHITISDRIKDDAAQALSELRALGMKKLIMLTGDKESIAANVAAELKELDEYHAELLPEDKVKFTRELIAKNKDGAKLAFVGDGINDAPVLSVADIGIAMGGMGSAAAVEAADIVLMNDRPTDIAKAVKIARKTMRIVKENICFSLGTKIAVLILAVFGLTSMWLAQFADVGVCLLCILNSMRALRS